MSGTRSPAPSCPRRAESAAAGESRRRASTRILSRRSRLSRARGGNGSDPGSPACPSGSPLFRRFQSHMVGISSIGVYIPRSRLDRSLIAKAWGGKQPPGEKAVAHHDEDALTLGVAAAHRCFDDYDPVDDRRAVLRVDLGAVPREADRERRRDGVRPAARDPHRRFRRLGARRRVGAVRGDPRGAERPGAPRARGRRRLPAGRARGRPRGHARRRRGRGGGRRQGEARRVRRRGGGRGGVHLPVARRPGRRRPGAGRALLDQPRLPARHGGGGVARHERARRRRDRSGARSPSARPTRRPRSSSPRRSASTRRRSSCRR